MKTLYSMYLVPALFAASVVVNAQSAPNFPVQVQTNLRVEYQSTNTDVNPAGTTLQQQDLLDEPTVQGPKDSTRTLTFLLFMIDQDASNGSGQRVQLLHFFQPNLSGGSEVLFADKDAANATEAASVSYLPPTPPTGDGAHRYTLLLYPQPKGFEIPTKFSSFFPPQSTSNRIGFDIAGFANAAGLGDPVAANWFKVQNGDSVATTSTSTSASSIIVSTSASVATSETTSSVDVTSAESIASTLTFTTAPASESAFPPASTDSAAATSGETSTPSIETFTIAASTTTDSTFGSASTESAGSTLSTAAAPSAMTASSGSSASASASASLGSASGSAGARTLAPRSLGSLVAGIMVAVVAGTGMAVW
ncbi:hypothetical protein A1O3_00825 [Capronia epimyces CBS 606.96]|uniref:Phosphatidylethanolamine-binding protein n=1 Tax=Capronia epimyces CBS 606.96 TaxID=1182542 RepID=W9YRG5_9EURO|nr:uncharacterized protein A1O3_00825 [Capronia epimyces CBS 606.96]EXJ92275.1 hypothetical protein A1O3_00825 [Capronia epimyces CBS 606.96]